MCGIQLKEHLWGTAGTDIGREDHSNGIQWGLGHSSMKATGVVCSNSAMETHPFHVTPSAQFCWCTLTAASKGSLELCSEWCNRIKQLKSLKSTYITFIKWSSVFHVIHTTPQCSNTVIDVIKTGCMTWHIAKHNMVELFPVAVPLTGISSLLTCFHSV